ncbi:Phthiocerol synthesis polyketide synthase type I PpsA [Symbiodinium microadriaticum]|uniref:Phthiocerol synthesis polyketide synthase type I PpsA n=2 Tax=Symbiodinium TaxID=2949 RepID=A0A1Q9EWU2_SYMMI|nr:Phthiocerol synthesis polyketide synthase type I PpsA [Symbiodinium microadriaticum]
MNSLGGMYLGYGTGNSDFGHVERTTDGSAEGSFGATGGSAAITANRFSFVLGMKGPSIAVDAEDASALLSVHMGCEALHTKGRALANEFSLCGGIKLNLAAFYWPQQQAAGWLSKVGRCQAFDGAADGWVHGDSSVNLLIKTLTENVDGKLVAKENEPYLASICGSSVRHAGYSASLAAPHGPTEQEVLSTAVYAAGLTGMDIDGCEMYGIGSQLADPVEANSCSRVLRLADDDDAPLLMKASKTGIGNAQHGGSGVSIMQSILTSIAGSIGPNMHLRQTNPYLDISELPLHFVTEDDQRVILVTVAAIVAVTVFVHEGTILDDGATLVTPGDAQVVLLPFAPASQEDMLTFIIAVQNGHVHDVEEILRRPHDPNRPRTALVHASTRGHVEVVGLLLEAGADKDGTDIDRTTGLQHASGRGHTEVVRLLLQAGADKDLADCQGRTALMYASQRGHAECARLLLKAKADKDLADKDGWTALICACSQGTEESVALLLRAGAQKDLADHLERTALIHTASRGHVEITRLLLNAGANTGLADVDRTTGLVHASVQGYATVVRLLLEARAAEELAQETGLLSHQVVPFRMASTFMTSFSRGFGGTNVSVVSYAAKDTSHLPDSAAPMPLADGLVFWPGGGGKVDGDSMPKEHFAIAGTFSEWEPQPMKKESEGVFSCSVTLGENRWEQFQIWLDGDPLRCLYPEQHKAPSKSSVCGPDADSGDDDLVDEEIAAHCHSAYLAYQSAKDRYKEAVRGRGVDQDAVKQRNEQRLKEAKARSYCSACKRRGHWHKDPECPLRGKVAPPKAEHERPHQAQMCNHVFVTSWCRPGACEKSSPDNADGYEDVPVDDGPRDTTDYQDELQTKGPQEPHGGATQDAEAKLVMMTAGGAEDGARGRRLNATTMNAIVDTACTRTVAGHDWYEEYCRLLDKAGQAPKIIEAVDHFKFGASKVHVSKFSVDAWFSTQGKAYVVNVAVVPCRVPLLFSRPVLAALGACYDIGAQKMSLAKLGLSEVPLIMGDTGHPVIPVDQFLGGRIPDIAVPVFEDAWIPAAQTEYKGVFAASASPSSPAPDPTTKRGIFYPKKLDPTIMSMVSGEWDLGGHTFFTWWRGAKQSRDFWVETESELIRVHVVPRKHTFNPSLWTTKYAHLKDALLDELADTRCTDVIPCLSEGVVLKRFQDVWLQSEDVKQDEILEELGSYNVLVHPRWTVPELRDILIEQRQTHGVPKAAAPDPMKGISKMTLDELVAEAQKQHITLPPKPTKGALLRMLRDSKSTEADTVVPFGKYKTWYYRELPRGYLQWAVQETKSGGSHPDLVRLANWAKTVLTDPAPPDEKEKKETLEDPETTAKTPPPRMERRLRDVPLSSDGSWAPVNFRPKPRQSRTREDSSSDSMDQEASGETMLEIAAIEGEEQGRANGGPDQAGRQLRAGETAGGGSESEETAGEEAYHSAYVVVNDLDSDDSEGPPPPRNESEATMKQRAKEGIRRRKRRDQPLRTKLTVGAHTLLHAMGVWMVMMQNVVAEPLSDAWAVLQPRHHDPEQAKRADFLELFGGRSPRLSEGFARRRRKVMMPRDPLHGHDLYHPAVQDEILKEIGEQRPKVIWMSPPALTQVWRRRPPEGASQEQRRDRKREDRMLDFLRRVGQLQRLLRGHFCVEAPQSSPLWRHPALSLWALEGDTYQVSIDLCQYEAPEPNKVYMAQTVELLATHEAFKELARRCPGNHPHMDFGRDFTSRARTWHATAFATAVVQVVDKVKTNPYVAFVTGDSPGGELAQPASDDGADDVEGANQLHCKTCSRSTKTRSAKVAHPASYLDFNEAVAIDVIWLSTSDSETARLPALNIVDLASTYQVVVLMESTKSAAAAKAFTQGWLHWAGAPKMVLADLDSAFKDKFAELLDRHRVGMRCSAGQAHWQNGVAERHGASWKAIWDKVVAAQGTLTEEAEETAAAVNDAKNTLRNHAGFSPRQWLFGSNDHRGDDYEQAVGETESPFDTTTPATKFGRLQALRLAAKTAFFETKAKEAVQRAGSHKPRVEGAAFEPGSLVYIYRLLRPGKGKKPKNTWLGPATVIGREGSNYWLARGGRCLLEVNEMLRVKLAKEADPDQYEVMSEGQDMEVDDLQAPPEGGGITMDAEMDFEGGIPREHGDDVPRSIKRLRLDPTPVGSARPPETSSVAASSSAGQLQTANMMVHRASEKGREKQREKELKWHEIPPQEQSLYVSAEKQQWDEHVKYEAVRALSLEESARVRREVPSSRILRSRFAYRDKNYSKRKADPNLGPKPKARLCVAGQTDPDLGTKDLMVDAPTASRHSILLACQLALERQWSASIGDISAAFLNGIKAPRQLYFEQPRRGIPSLEKGQLVEILKGVFGLSTSPKLWWLRLSEELLNLELSFGGEKVKTVQLRRGESSRRTHGVILTHVDDLLLMSEPGLQKPIQELLGSKFPIDGWEDNEFEYIGCEYKFTKAPDSDEASPEQIEENRTSVGSLSWLAKQTRPDLQFSVASCQRCQNHPTVKDLKATNKAVAAAKQHKDEALVLRRIGETNLAICVYHDAAWANVPDDAANEEDDAWLGGHSVASQLGYLVMAMGTQAIAGEESAFSLLDWRSKASSRVCRSTFAGETMSCGEGLESALYLRSLLIGMITGEAANEETAAWYVPIHLFTDCRSLYDHVHREGAPKAPSEKRLAIDLAALRQTLMREAKVQWLQKHGPEVTLTPERPLRPPLHWVPTEDQLADMMTKAMRPDAWRSNSWLLDGRPQAELRLRPKGPPGGASGAAEEATGRGLAGSAWKVRLAINGKWRLVDLVPRLGLHLPAMSLCMVLVLVLPSLVATEPVSEGAPEDLAESSWNNFLYCKCGLSCQLEEASWFAKSVRLGPWSSTPIVPEPSPAQIGSWHVFTLGSACGCLECPDVQVAARQPAEVPKQPLDGDAAVAQAIGAEVSAPNTKLRATWDSAHMKSANLLFCRCGKHRAKGRYECRGVRDRPSEFAVQTAAKSLEHQSQEWERLEQPLVPVEDLKKGAYFITADFNGWGIEPMVQQADGSWTFEVHLIRPGGQFQILRNRDSEQVLYPAAWADRDPSAVRGPDDGSDGRCWYLKGEQCDVFCVSLQRRIDDGLDVKKVSIERTGQKELNDAQLRQLGRLRLAAFGTWDRGSRLRELPWAGTCFHFFVQLGSEGRESFQLLEDFNWNRVIHPSVPNARAAVEYKVEGPEVGDAKTRGLNWTIGLDGYEKPGDVFEVLVYGETHRVERVRWQRVDPMIGAAAIRKAEETGLLFGK